MRENDILISINDKTIQKPDDMITIVRQSQMPVNFIVRGTGGIIRNITITPENGKIGSYVGYNVTEIRKDFRYKYGFIESYKQSLMTLELLGKLVQKIISPKVPMERTEAMQSLGGPIAI